MVPAFERWARLRGVDAARTILERAFGLALVLVGPDGALAHRRGGVIASSNELCRRMLFHREGFARCDAEYARVGSNDEARPREQVCHLGLRIQSVPVLLDGDVLGHVVAPGWVRNQDEVNGAALLAGLEALSPHGVDHQITSEVRRLPALGESLRPAVRAVLHTVADQISAFEAERRRRASGDEDIPGLWGLIGRSPQMQAVFDLLPRLAESDATVLIQGESGTGKELIARALHRNGRRAQRELVAQNCAALPDNLLETALFGHVKGAFSGADRASGGLFGSADGGTLFLDEVGDMSPALQVKLLRVLQDGSYHPVGSTTPRQADVRVMAATHHDLRALVAKGQFRQDLFYRLHVLPVRLPALRDRVGDLQPLLAHFMAETDNVPTAINEAAWECLRRHKWPGNVRELRAEVQRWQLVGTDSGPLGPEHLSPQIREAGGFAGFAGGAAAAAAAAGRGTLAEAVESLERMIIERGLERTRGNRTQLAKDLGISRTTLGERLKRYGMD